MSAWLRRKRAPPPPPTLADLQAECVRVRAHLLEQGRSMAPHRAIERFMAVALEDKPQADPGWAQVLAELEVLRGNLRAFDRLWAAWQEPLALGPVPELTAAEEVALRMALQAQLRGAGS